MPVLAIDQGTSATKALVVDDDGTVLGIVTRHDIMKILGL